MWWPLGCFFLGLFLWFLFCVRENVVKTSLSKGKIDFFFVCVPQPFLNRVFKRRRKKNELATFEHLCVVVSIQPKIKNVFFSVLWFHNQKSYTLYTLGRRMHWEENKCHQHCVYTSMLLSRAHNECVDHHFSKDNEKNQTTLIWLSSSHPCKWQ